jgi:hypothetical protein
MLFSDLHPKEAWDGVLSCWRNAEVSNVVLGLLALVGCFCLGLSNDRRDQVDPDRLLVNLLLFEAS